MSKRSAPHVRQTQCDPERKSNGSNGFALIIILVGVLILAGVAGGVFYATKLSTPKVSQTPADTSPAPTGAGETANWKTYTNEKYGYSIKYPPNYFVKSNLSQDIRSRNSSQLIFEISNSEKFDTDQFAFIISNYITNKSLPQINDPAYKAYNDMLNSSLSINELPAQTVSAFTGNPPYGIYEVSIPLKKQPNLYLLISAAIHNQNEKEDLEIFNQILSTFKFLDQNQNNNRELIKATDVYQKGQIDKYGLDLLSNFSWPKLKPFKSGDKTREVYLVDCTVTNADPWVELIGIPTEAPNVSNIAEATLKKLVENHYGGFPNQESIAGLEKTYNVHYKNADSGINGVLLKDGNLIINFYDSVAAYGGGSAAVQCLGLSTELTAKQFPTIKTVTMCIDKYGDKYDCSLDFQP